MHLPTTRRRIVLHLLWAILAMTLVAGPAPAATAQEGSPEAAVSLLAGLGLPTLDVTVTSDGIAAPAGIGAGPVLLTVSNETDVPALVEISQLPEGITIEDYLALSDNADGSLPEWVADVVAAGGVEVPPMASGRIVLNLAAGEWTIIADAYAETEFAQPTAGLTVTGEAAAATIAADVDVDMGAYVLDFPDTLAAGPQIWHVFNSHTVPHHVAVLPVDRLYTADEVANGLMAEFSGTPVAGGFSFASSLLAPPTVGPVITGGQEVWMELNLEPGFYVALCFISDPGSDVPHVMQGMVDAFEVTAN